MEDRDVARLREVLGGRDLERRLVGHVFEHGLHAALAEGGGANEPIGTVI